jgi:hypothetical protein
MSNRTLTALVLAALGLAPGCGTLPTSAQAKVSYKAEVSQWPMGVTCLNKPVMDGIAKEVLNGSRREVVIAGGPKAISDAQWPAYSPSLGNQKNSDRHTLFSTSCFSRSPGKSADCGGDDCRDFIDMDGYSWVGLSKIEAADCVPTASDCDGATPKAGGLLFVVTKKCHELVFKGEALFLRGPGGVKAIMHATADGNPTTDVPLPKGWTLTRETLAAPLTVHPFGGGSACFYNIIRDSKAQSYHQLVYAGATYP